VARGETDFSLIYSINYVAAIDAGNPITLLAGVHVGWYELFAAEGIHTVADLKGKSAGVGVLGSTGALLVTMMAAYVCSTPPRTSIG
jgi:NitT/TauT family transport system substrate-binding protein